MAEEIRRPDRIEEPDGNESSSGKKKKKVVRQKLGRRERAPTGRGVNFTLFPEVPPFTGFGPHAHAEVFVPRNGGWAKYRPRSQKALTGEPGRKAIRKKKESESESSSEDSESSDDEPIRKRRRGSKGTDGRKGRK